jgi:hypothetical protein
VERVRAGWSAGSGRAAAGRPPGSTAGGALLLAGGALLLAAGTGLLAGCSPTAVAGTRGDGATCGTTRTAANVPVVIKVAKGTVNCGMALQVENKYAAMIRDGQVRGNGGGAPVAVGGWTCQGYPTPEVLSTGDASQCHTNSATIIAVIPFPTPPAASTVG